MPSNYNLFISHSWSYSDAYEKLIELLDDKAYFFYNNHSVPKGDPVHNAQYDYQLYNAIKNRVQNTHVVLILAGVYSTHSKWINKEIKIAQTEFTTPKPIIAIQPWGAKHTSDVVKKAADLIVGWNTDSIVNAIRSVA